MFYIVNYYIVSLYMSIALMTIGYSKYLDKCTGKDSLSLKS